MAATGMDPGFQTALEAMFKDAPGSIGITSGFRDTAQQTNLRAVAEQQHPGQADQWAAKPGTSWHEFGEAADLHYASPSVLQWAHDNAARYGLFFPMSWEPWHVQPLWTQGHHPGDAGMAGATGGVAGGTMPPPGALDQGAGQPADPVGVLLGHFVAGLQGKDEQHTVDGQTIGSRFADMLGQQSASIGMPAAGAGAAGANAGAFSGGYQGAYQTAIKAGATPQEASLLAAIAGPESGYNPKNHNPNASTGDDSYGLWQINMLGNMGVQRAKSWGLSSYDDLYDPMTNAKAALYILHTQGPTAWTAYKDGTYKQYMPAQSAAPMQVL